MWILLQNKNILINTEKLKAIVINKTEIFGTYEASTNILLGKYKNERTCQIILDNIVNKNENKNSNFIMPDENYEF